MIAALLVADGRTTGFSAPTWTPLICAVALTAGTALGGWRIVQTIGRGIFRLHPLDGSGRPERLRRRAPRRLGDRRARLDDPGRGLFDPRRRRRPQAMAPRALDDRASDGTRLGDHAADRGAARRRAHRRLGDAAVKRPLVPARVTGRAGAAARQIAVTIEGLDGVHRLGRRRHAAGTRARARASRRRGAARAAPRAARRLRHAARARGPVRALTRNRPDHQPGQGRRPRVRGHGLPAGRADGRDGGAARRCGARARRGVARLEPGDGRGTASPPTPRSRPRATSSGLPLRDGRPRSTSTICAW